VLLRQLNNFINSSSGSHNLLIWLGLAQIGSHPGLEMVGVDVEGEEQVNRANEIILPLKK
jgi:hypothetical protein